MKLSKLIYENEYKSFFNANNINVVKIVSDTSEMCEGAVFVCLSGTKFNTHSLAGEIANAGAAAIIAEKGEKYDVAENIPVFEVENTHRILAFMWSRYYGNPQNSMKIIGITGTNGKTSVSYMISEIMANSGIKTGVIGTINCLIDQKPFIISEDSKDSENVKTMTTPDPNMLYKILHKMKQNGVKYVIMEVSSHALYFDKVAPICFDVGVFTNLSSEHMDFHKSMENYFNAKSKLFTKCKCSVINIDDGYGWRIYDLCDSDEKILCSLQHKEEAGFVTACEIRQNSTGVEYVYSSECLRFALKVKIPGLFTVYNSMLASAVAIHIGISPIIVRNSLSNMKSVFGRMERLSLDKTVNDFSVFIDFAHTEEALRNLLTTVRNFKREEERIVVLFGCGGERDKTKRAPMGKTASELADFLIVTSDNSRNEDPKDIISDILSGIPENTPKKVIVNRRDAIEYAIVNAKRNDIILLVGKGHETYEITKEGHRAFDEREIVKNAIKMREKDRI